MIVSNYKQHPDNLLLWQQWDSCTKMAAITNSADTAVGSHPFLKRFTSTCIYASTQLILTLYVINYYW